MQCLPGGTHQRAEGLFARAVQGASAAGVERHHLAALLVLQERFLACIAATAALAAAKQPAKQPSARRRQAAGR